VRGGLALLERVTQLQPTFAGAFAAKADTLVRVGAFEAAVEAFERARELGLWDVHLRFGLGTSLVGLQRWEEARDCFEALAKEQPGDGDTWLELAITRLRSESLESAEEALARAKETGTATARLLENVEQSLARARARRERKAEGGAPR
jgi:tetratricopeptide (TPR) repeat protein